jgi:hypothetical protein
LSKQNIGQLIGIVFAVAIFLGALDQTDPQLASNIWGYLMQMLLVLVGGTITITIIVKFVLNFNFN